MSWKSLDSQWVKKQKRFCALMMSATVAVAFVTIGMPCFFVAIEMWTAGDRGQSVLDSVDWRLLFPVGIYGAMLFLFIWLL